MCQSSFHLVVSYGCVASQLTVYVHPPLLLPDSLQFEPFDVVFFFVITKWLGYNTVATSVNHHQYICTEAAAVINQEGSDVHSLSEIELAFCMLYGIDTPK